MPTFVYWVLVLFCFCPILPVAKGWIEIASAKSKFETVEAALLLLVTASFAWIVLGLALPPTDSTVAEAPYRNGILMLFHRGRYPHKKEEHFHPDSCGLTFLVWDYLAGDSLSRYLA